MAMSQDNGGKGKTTPASKRFVYLANSKIEKRTYDSIYFDVSYVKGKKMVFKYSYIGADVEMIADDEYYESFEFEINPPKGNTFSFSSNQFEENKVLFKRSCFCLDGGIRQLYEGKITGKKINNTTWLVEMDVEIVPRDNKTRNPIQPVRRKLKGYFHPGGILY